MIKKIKNKVNKDNKMEIKINKEINKEIKKIMIKIMMKENNKNKVNKLDKYQKVNLNKK